MTTLPADRTAYAPVAYLLCDRDGRILAVYATRARASRRQDRLDNEHGAYRYSVRAVYMD